MRAVILAGGRGERLRPLTDKVRKAYLPLGDKRVVDHIIDRLPKWLVFEVSEDDSGAVSAVSHSIKDNSPLMVICGDNYFSDNLDGFIWDYSGYTLVGIYNVNSLDRARALGVVELSQDQKQIIRIVEKPMYPSSTLVSTGIYIFPPEVFGIIHNLAQVKPNTNLGTLISYILSFQPVFSYLFTGIWFDIGTPESYEAAKKLFEAED